MAYSTLCSLQNALTSSEHNAIVLMQGVIGLSSLSSAWLSMHVVLGGLAAAALAAHDTVVFGLLELRQAPDHLPLSLDVRCYVHASLPKVHFAHCLTLQPGHS